MAINKVIYDGNTLMDVTEDTVTPETLAKGITAHGANGEPIVGLLPTVTEEEWNGKVNVSDIANNLTTNAANKPLSAAQGVILKGLVDNLTTVSNNATTTAGNAATTANEAKSLANTANTNANSAKTTAQNASDKVDNLEERMDSGEFKGETGKTGKDGVTPVKGVDYFTEADKTEIANEAADSVRQTLVNQRYVKTVNGNAPDSNGNVTVVATMEAPSIVSSIEEMTDTSKQYVLQSNGHIYVYKETTTVIPGGTVANFTNLFDADKAMIGYRWSGSGKAPTASPYNILSDFIPCDLSSGEHTIRIKNGFLHGASSQAGVVYFTTNENSAAFDTTVNSTAPVTNEADGVRAYRLGAKTSGMVANYTSTRYIRCVACQRTGDTEDGSLVSPANANSVKNIIITIDEPITYTTTEDETITTSEWVDTGIVYGAGGGGGNSAGDLIGVLGENNVVYISSNNMPSGTYTLKNADSNYAVIGTITV